MASAAVVAAALIAGGAYVLGRTTDGQSTSPATDSAIEGMVWRLLGYDGEQPRTNSLATLYVSSDGHLVADDTCELITGQVAGSSRTVRDLQVRNYNCTDAVGEVTFDRGVRALRSDAKWSIDGDRLTISGSGTVMHLAVAPELPAPTADRPTYTETTWALSKVVDASGVEQKVRDGATLRIADGRLVASDTCNTISGEAHLDGNRLRATNLAVTSIGCPNQHATSHVIDRVLSDGAELDLRGPTLTVTNAGAGTLAYTWKPQDQQATDPDRLTATTWRLRTVAGERAHPGTTLRITKDGMLTLAAACETASGRATVAAGAFTATGVPEEPEAGCPPEISTLQSFLANNPLLWHIDHNQLIVNESGAQGFALLFDAEEPQSVDLTAQLAGVSWRLVGIENVDGTSGSGHSVTDGARLEFDGHGGFTLQERCRNVSGRAVLDSRPITFDNARPADHSCPSPAHGRTDNADRIADRFVSSGTATWTIRDGQLELTKGNVTLTFAR